MENKKEIMEIIEAAGFSCTGEIQIKSVELMEEVRDMCQNGNCGMYGKKLGLSSRLWKPGNMQTKA